jgi:hypothetical protein
LLSVVWKPGIASSQIQAQIDFKPGVGSSSKPLDLERLKQEMAAEHPLPAGASLRRIGSLGGGDGIAIELTASDEAAGIATVQNLANQLLLHSRHLAVTTGDAGELAAAREALLQSLTQEDKARRAVDNLVKQHIEQLHRIENAAPGRANIEAPPQENAVWVEQQNEIAALSAQRAKLLENLTELHPKVVDATSRLDDLRARQASTPRFLNGSAQPPLEDNTKQEELLEVASNIAGERGPLRTALDHYEAARSQRQQAQAAVEVLERSATTAPALQPRFELSQGAKVVARVPTVSPVTRLLVLLSASGLVFVLVTLSLRPRQAASLLASPDDVAQWLHVPVVARLRLGQVRV